MKRFKYKVVDIKDFDARYGSILNSFGEDGWELINIASNGSGFSKTYYFKKEVESTKSTPHKLEG